MCMLSSKNEKNEKNRNIHKQHNTHLHFYNDEKPPTAYLITISEKFVIELPLKLFFWHAFIIGMFHMDMTCFKYAIKFTALLFHIFSTMCL